MEDKLEKYEGLIELTQTTEDLVKLDEEIDLLLQGIYHVSEDALEDILGKMVRIRVAMEMRKLIKQNNSSKKEEVKALFSSMYRTVCALPILQLTLAFEPSEAVIGNISRWARKNLVPGILLDLTLDRSVLGGAMISYHGKFYDLTLKKKLQEIFDKGDLRIV
jgi:F0F1-type ATP synthase delta subunit